MKKAIRILMAIVLFVAYFMPVAIVHADDQSRLQVIHIDGGGTFTVSGGPYDGITNYSNSTSNFIDIGTQVTLTATPDNYHNFTGWYNCQEVEMANNPSIHTWETVGNALSTNATYQFEINASYYNIMPVFESKFGHNNIWTYGNGTVAVLYENRNAMEEVNTALDGITYQGSHMVDYIKGDQITVKAQADENNVFIGWYESNVQQGPAYYNGHVLISSSPNYTYTPGVTTVEGLDEPVNYLTAVFRNAVTVIDEYVAQKTETEEVPYDTDLAQYVSSKEWDSTTKNSEENNRWLQLFGEENGVYSYPKAEDGLVYTFVGQTIENGIKHNHYQIKYTKVIVTKADAPACVPGNGCVHNHNVTAYSTTVKGSLTVHGIQDFTHNTTSSETPGNINNDSINTLITGTRTTLDTFAASYGVTPTYTEGIKDYYYDFITYVECPAAEVANVMTTYNVPQERVNAHINGCNYDDGDIHVCAVLNKHQTYEITGEASQQEVSRIELTLATPYVGDIVQPIGYTGDNPDSIKDDGSMTPNVQPEFTTSTSNISLEDAYWITGTELEYPDEWELLHFGRFNKETDYYAIVTINANAGYYLANNLQITINGIGPAEVFGIINNGSTTRVIAKIQPIIRMQDYDLTEGDNEIHFRSEAGQILSLNVTEIMSLSEEEIRAIIEEMNAGLDPEEQVTYEEIVATKTALIEEVRENTKAYGYLLGMYEISVTNGTDDIHTAENGFRVKLKLPEGTPTYKKYYLLYVDNNNKVVEKVELTRNGNYVEGILPHLSSYALVGDNTPDPTVPNTSDNILFNISMLLISLIGLTGVGIYTKKRLEN